MTLKALDFCYKNGLSKNIKVITNSPSILINKNIKKQGFFQNSSRNKLIKYQKSIFPFSKKVFDKIIKDTNIDQEVAVLCAVLSNQLSNFIFKISQLNASLKNKKILFIKLSNSLYNSTN